MFEIKKRFLSTTLIAVMTTAPILGNDGAHGSTLQQQLQKAVAAKECPIVLSLLPKLTDKEPIYFNTLSNFYEKGFCFSQDYEKAFEAYLKTPEDYTEFRDIKLGQFYENGWGISQNTQKAKEFFQRGIRKELLRHENFSHVRLGLELFFGTKVLPEQLEDVVSHYETINWTVDQKYKFAVGFLDEGHSKELVKQVYAYLMRLESDYKHAPSAYLIAKWLEQNEGFEASASYLYAAAKGGDVNAQADIGRSYFFDHSEVFKQRIAYEMLYRAYLEGQVSSEDIQRAERKLNKFEIQMGREEATKPLPAQNE